MDNAYKDYSSMTPKEKRDFWFRKVKSNHAYIKERFDKEVKLYLKIFRHQFQDLLPESILTSDNVDVNIVYPIIKTLIPKLYFQDPKVFLKAMQEKIVVPQTQVVADENGNPAMDESGQTIEQPLTDPLTGQQVVEEYDGVRSALILQSRINYNIRMAKLKQHEKMCIYDAHLGFYGALKTGWGNEQGVHSMGEGAPVSPREDTSDELAYAIRIKPWHVVPDVENFYDQEWTAVYYCAHPSRLKMDKRLQHTDEIKGTAKMDEKVVRERGKFLDKDDTVLTEWFEIYVKPCAAYPEGGFFVLSEEVKDDFLFSSAWPYASKCNPIKFIYFNPDPEGGLPIPDVRYYAGQQKAKSAMRKIALEYSMRALPFVGVDFSGIKNPAEVEKALRSGITPKFVPTNGRNPNQVLAAFSHNNLNADFWRFDGIIDDDVSRMVGMVKGVYPGSGEGVELASVAKIADAGEAIRQNERADIVRDHMTEVLSQWVDYYKEFAGPENYDLVDGEKFPTKWTVEQIQMRMDLEVKPFSMNYEDPTIRRRQWVDLLNLLGGPAIQAALQQQGAQVDFVKMVKRVLETYDERDVETFMITGDMKPENQVARAIQNGFTMMQTGEVAPVTPTDNHKLFILIYGLFLQIGAQGPFEQAIAAHEQSLLALAPGSPGGGNAEGLPQVGNAANQDQLRQPLQPSATNSATAQKREATKTR
jgi:hypothetical protein